MLPALIAVVAIVQLWMAWRWFGFLTGDDVEVLAEAFRVATNFSYRAWDIRNLFIPDVIVAPAIAVAVRLGVTDVRTLSVVAAGPFILATAVTIALLFLLARRWCTREGALVAAALFAFHWIPLGFGSTVYPRTIATLSVVAAAFVITRSTTWRAHFVAGALLGLAFADRFSEIVFLLPVIALVAVTNRERMVRSIAALLAGLALSAVLLVGLFDRFTWGEWFGSVRRFAHLTLVRSDFASHVKRQPAYWYVSNILRWISPTLLPFFWFARKKTRAVEIALFIVLPLLALSMIAHKELRYLQGTIPWVALLAGVGFDAMRSSGHRRAAVLLVIVSVIWSAAGLTAFTRKSMPAVEAAAALGADRSVHTVAMTQLWAYGDRLYFGDRMQVIDVGEPPARLGQAFPYADAICLYETDMTPEINLLLQQHGFVRVARFDRPPARAVLTFRRR